MSDKKVTGRRRAQQKKLDSMFAAAAEFLPASPPKVRNVTDKCQLCGMAIGYDYLLKHNTDESKNLLVGSDCLINFARDNWSELQKIVGGTLQDYIRRMETQIEL